MSLVPMGRAPPTVSVFPSMHWLLVQGKNREHGNAQDISSVPM